MPLAIQFSEYFAEEPYFRSNQCELKYYRYSIPHFVHTQHEHNVKSVFNA